MYGFVARLTPDDLAAIAAQLYVEMLEAGFTSVGEFHYLHHAPDGAPYDDRGETSARLVEAARRTGIGITLLPVLYAAGGFGGVEVGAGQRRFAMTADEFIALVADLAGRWRDDAGVRMGVALHSLRAVPPDGLARALAGREAIDATAPVHIHIAEQVREVEDCLAWCGARPIEWLLDNAAVGERWCLVHATHISEAETGALAASGAVAGLCPTTEANLGDGLFPLRSYLDAGGRFGVGSDSHISVSPVEELRWLEYGQRLTTLSRNVVAEAGQSSGEALYGAALAGGARALARPVGALAPGLRADLVVLDAGHPALVGRDSDQILDSWLFSGNTSSVRDVMVGGEWVVRDGAHAQREFIAAAYRKCISDL